MFTHQIPGSNWGLFPPQGLWPFHILHFPFSPLIGCMRHFFLYYAPCVMFWKHSNKENLALTCFINIHDLKQLRTLLGLQWKEWREGILGFPDLLHILESFIVCVCWLGLSCMCTSGSCFMCNGHLFWPTSGGAVTYKKFRWSYFVVVLQVSLWKVMQITSLPRNLCVSSSSWYRYRGWNKNLLAAHSSIVGESKFHWKCSGGCFLFYSKFWFKTSCHGFI